MEIRTASPLLEPTGAGSLPRRRCAASPAACGRWARRSPRCTSRAGEGRCGRSTQPRRKPRLDMRISFARRSSRFSHSITDACGLARGHPGIDPRRCRPGGPTGGPTPPRSRAGVPPGRSLQRLSRSRRHVGRRGARLARSLRRCRSATTGLSRARCRSRCSGLCCHGSSFHPRQGPPGEPVGVTSVGTRVAEVSLLIQDRIDLDRQSG